MTNMIAANTANNFSAAAKAVNSAAAAGKLAEADNGQMLAMLAGIQQSSRDTAQAMKALATEFGNQHGRGCCCCGGGCWGGCGCCYCCGNRRTPVAPVAGAGCNTVLAVVDDSSWSNGGEAVNLVSYYKPLTSQVEADEVKLITYLGGVGLGHFGINSGGTPFTLDGFFMPGRIPEEVYNTIKYPCTFMRKKDNTGWFLLNQPDMVWMDWDMVAVHVSYDALDDEKRMCCGLYSRDFMGKMFIAQIDDLSYWPEEQKKWSAFFTFKRSEYSKNFGGSAMIMAEHGNTQFPVTTDPERYNCSWEELYAKFGNKPFRVDMPSNAPLIGLASAI